MRFSERKEFLYDPELFGRNDTQTALRIYAEWVKRHTARPMPRFFEVNRDSASMDPYYNVPTGPRTIFSRELDIPAINLFEKPKFRRLKHGSEYSRYDKFLLAHNILKELDYFPIRGDQVYWNGYRYDITEVVLEPDSYWQQTNVFMGIYVEAVASPTGDARPPENPATRLPAEKPGGL